MLDIELMSTKSLPESNIGNQMFRTMLTHVRNYVYEYAIYTQTKTRIVKNVRTTAVTLWMNFCLH